MLRDATALLKGHKADTWPTQGAYMADICGRGQSAVKADTRWTQGGQAPGTRPEHIAANLYKREPHSKQFGEKARLADRPTVAWPLQPFRLTMELAFVAQSVRPVSPLVHGAGSAWPRVSKAESQAAQLQLVLLKILLFKICGIFPVGIGSRLASECMTCCKTRQGRAQKKAEPSECVFF